MKFHYSFDVKKLATPITHRHALFLIGSCFTENMGEKLSRFHFPVLQNPHGILFNPVSVAEALTHCIENRVVMAEELFPLHDSWHSWQHHSRFSGITPEAAVEKINASTTAAHRFLKNADYVMITLGSAWIYTLTEKAAGGKAGAVVANNHKAPADWFQRRLMTIEEVLRVLDNLVHRLFLFNPKLQILFTISPVRHLREGVVENNRSKAVLINTVHHLVDKFARLYYFPAYELVIDDLRDYRFYAEDLVHPNYQATQYVWEKFVEACVDAGSRQAMEELSAIHLAYQHKPLNPQSAGHLQFLQKMREKTMQLQQRMPELDLSKELEYFRTGLRDAGHL